MDILDSQRALFKDIKKEIDNIDRMLNNDLDPVNPDWLMSIYQAVCVSHR